MELKRKNTTYSEADEALLIAPLMELKIAMSIIAVPLVEAFNRTAYGIENAFASVICNVFISFNRTAYGIEK